MNSNGDWRELKTSPNGGLVHRVVHGLNDPRVALHVRKSGKNDYLNCLRSDMEARPASVTLPLEPEGLVPSYSTGAADPFPWRCVQTIREER
jgi:hypothetical protein